MDYNNPAEVLNYWLSQAFHTAKPQTPADQVWMTVWGLEDDLAGNRELMARAWSLTETAAEVRRRAEAMPAGSIILTPFTEIEEALNNFTTVKAIQRAGFFEPVKGTGWMCLKQLVAFLADDGHTPLELDEAKVASLVDQTRQLEDAVVADTSLPADLKRDILDRLQEVVTRLLRVEVGGGPEIARAIDGLSGVIIRIGLRSRDLLDHPLVNSMWRVCSGLAVVVGMAADFNTLAAGGAASLLALPPGGSQTSNGGSGGGGSH